MGNCIRKIIIVVLFPYFFILGIITGIRNHIKSKQEPKKLFLSSCPLARRLDTLERQVPIEIQEK